ncbi:hypothetical protein D9611_014900 [Ephemerocybe angulata]|uniref:Fungal-type protein kinase domain-containing protein n=1 Tax=Ephemerocybe angulata TaxID=980116 RepID=A0A8H5FES6_9AGAR|nr:hypothetical protein D9611_014900 [Tulosesus angulatus]
MEKAGLQGNGLKLSFVPGAESVVESDIDDSASDDSFEGGYQRTSISVASLGFGGLTVPVALSLDEVNAVQNRERLVQAMRESMEDDISRNFIYGISVEDDRVSLWYSTRKTTIKATSFSYVNRPDLLIRVFVSLFSADRESAQTQPQSFFFKTTHLISKGHTHIWNAVEVTSKSNLKPKHKGQEIVLKDTWVDADSATEFELQRILFQDIDSLRQSDWESLPILMGIPSDREEFARLRGYLKDDSYKSLFLRYDERMCYTGRPGKSLPSEHVWEPVSNQVEPDTLAEDVEHNERNRRSSQRKPREEWPTQNPPTLSSKKRCFFVFPELCTRVSDLPTLGDAMEVLNQAYSVRLLGVVSLYVNSIPFVALLIMFCAGWVHRDISDGNVLAIKVDGKWSVRLADLEFAKKCSPKLATSPDATIGTPYFIAYEIEASLLLWVRHEFDFKKVILPVFGRGKAIPAASKAVVHTFFHDIESLWWLIVWLITSRIGCDASKIAAHALFQGHFADSERRGNVVIGGLSHDIVSSLHDDVKPIAARLEPFRVQLYGDYLRNSPEMRLEYENYAPACATALIFFDDVRESCDVWASFPLQQSLAGTRAPQPRPQLGLNQPASEASTCSSRPTTSRPPTKRKLRGSERGSVVLSACMEEAGLQVNGLRLSLVPDVGSDGGDDIDDNASDNSVEGGQRTGEGSNPISPFGLTVPVAFRLNEEVIAQNQRQLAQAMGESMDDDVSRNFIYGISIEGNRVSLWYSTRHTTVKATSFSYIKRPDLLIRVLVSLFSADRDALGYESHITSLADGSYLYELDGIAAKAGNLKSSQRLRSKAVPKQEPSFFFKTTHLVSTGNSRIWKAVEVMSKSNLKPKHRGREVILKDTWVDTGSATEFELQHQLFQDIDILKQSDWESLPILKGIPPDREEFRRLRGYLKDDTYKSLFLRYDERMHYAGQSTKSLSPEQVWNPANTPGVAHTLAGNLEQHCRTTTRPHPLKDGFVPNLCLTSRRRCFFVFPDTCKRVSDLPTLGDAMDVLNQAYYALLLMFCAGWVHRDISDGNILATEVDSKWIAKLSDLEYAKKVPSNVQRSPEPKTGTPYFMAYEIQSSNFICPPAPLPPTLTFVVWGKVESKKRTEPPACVVHTFFHDIESLYWLILWIITSRVGCDASEAAAQIVFTSRLIPARYNVLRGGIPASVTSRLHDSVKPIASALETLQFRLFQDYFRNTPDMRMDSINYAPICAVPLIFFHNIKAFRESWASLCLRRPAPPIEAPHNLSQSSTTCGPPSVRVLTGSGPRLSKRKFLHDATGSSMGRLPLEGRNGGQAGPSKRMRTLYGSEGNGCVHGHFTRTNNSRSGDGSLMKVKLQA